MMNLGVRNVGVGVYGCFCSVAVMIGASTSSMIGDVTLAFRLGALMLSPIVVILSFLFALTTGELFCCSLVDCLAGVCFSLSLVRLLSLGVAYQSAVYSPSVVGACSPSEVGLHFVGVTFAGMIMPGVLFRVCLECTRGA